ncbi:MAG: hypothetical protein K2M65_07655, partial [Muribaculaceae bacterium]|nr:hypothetical protein [Muribaculaceae bacterium]
TVDWAHLPDFGFMAEHIDEEFYDQLAGKDMLATMEYGELRQLDVSGNVQGILLPMENDSTYNKINNIETSFLIVNFRGDSIERAIMWPETSGTTTPLYLAKKSLYYLPQFKWYEIIRPTSPDDVFAMPQEMLVLFAQPDPTSPAALLPRKAKEKKSKPLPIPDGTDQQAVPVTAPDGNDAEATTPEEEKEENSENTEPETLVMPEKAATIAEPEEPITNPESNEN